MINLFNDLINSEMSTALLAQTSRVRVGDSPNTGSSLITFLIQIIIYCFVSYCTQTFLKKLGYEKAWYAWIPIVSTYAILEAGEQEDPLVWTLVSLIPFIGLIALIKIIPAYIRICERLGKPPAILWTFLLCGLGAFIVPFVLAFT